MLLPDWENQATSTMTWYPTQLHYPDGEKTSPFPILIMPNTRLGSYKHQSILYQWFDSTRVQTCEVRMPRTSKMGDGWFTTHSAILSGSWELPPITKREPDLPWWWHCLTNMSRLIRGNVPQNKTKSADNFSSLNYLKPMINTKSKHQPSFYDPKKTHDILWHKTVT